MEPGELRHRVEIKKNSPSRTGTGGFTNSFARDHYARAKISPYIGSETAIAAALEGKVMSRIKLRWYDGTLVPKDQIVNGTDVYDVLAVLDLDLRRHEIVVLAELVIV